MADWLFKENPHLLSGRRVVCTGGRTRDEAELIIWNDTNLVRRLSFHVELEWSCGPFNTYFHCSQADTARTGHEVAAFQMVA